MAEQVKDKPQERFSDDDIDTIKDGTEHIEEGCAIIRRVVERNYKDRGPQRRDYNLFEDSLIKVEEANLDITDKIETEYGDE